MTILRFVTINHQDYIGWNDEPVIIQKNGGCRSMYAAAEQWGGLMFSDEKIEGWLPAKIGSGHLYGSYPGYGDIIGGILYEPQAKAAGFDMHSKDLCWRTGNAAWKLKSDQWEKYYALGNDARKRFLDGLYPDEKEPLLKPAARKREGKRVVAKDFIPF